MQFNLKNEIKNIQKISIQREKLEAFCLSLNESAPLEMQITPWDLKEALKQAKNKMNYFSDLDKIFKVFC